MHSCKYTDVRDYGEQQYLSNRYIPKSAFLADKAEFDCVRIWIWLKMN